MAFSLAVGLVTKLLGDLKHTALVSAPSYARRLGTLAYSSYSLFIIANSNSE